jgi:outer membrane protein assembly factor BamB
MIASSALWLAFLLSLASAPPSDPGRALREAAGQGDVARARELLDAGTPADAANLEGVTPLLYAAEKGHLEMVRLLLARGANVNARDQFFGGSAMSSALGGGHLEVATFLLTQGSEDATAVLAEGIERDDIALARAALATGKVGRLDLQRARREAEGKSAELKTLLAAAPLPPATRDSLSLPTEALKKYVGRYRGEKSEITVEVRETTLAVVAPGAADVVVRPVAPDRFEDADGSTAVEFWGRGGTVESLALNHEGEVAQFRPILGADPVPLKQAAAPAAEAAPRQAARPWPAFRGAGASGVGDGQGAPWRWNVASGENIRFRTELPGMALSSPIVWGGRIFVTSAVSAKGDATIRTGLYGDPTSVDDLSEHSFRLIALDAATGKILWDREVHRGQPGVKRHMKSSQANATPVTDGKRVIALFGSVGILAAYDLEGNPIWKKDIGVLDCGDPVYGTAEWGHASSPILHGGHIIVQADRRHESFLAAYRIEDGAEVWRTSRDEPSTWGTPSILPGPAGDEIVTNGKTIRGYDAATGALLWTLGPNSETIVATPVIGDGIAFVTGGYPPVRPIYAIRPGGRGDLTLPEASEKSQAIAWSHARGGTYLPTPLVYRDLLYLFNNNGTLSSYRAATGEQVYQTRVGSNASFSASPVAADGRLYFPSETGEIYVLRAGPEFELLATNDMDEVVMASPAISDGLLLIRTLGHLVGIAEGAAVSGTAASGR